MKWLRLIPVLAISMLLISCGSGGEGKQQQQSYKDTKSMVIDVLKTEDAQKAIQDAIKKNQDSTAKLLSTGEGQQIQIAVKDVLTDPNHAKLIEKTMMDPKFAGDFAKAIQKSNKQLQKDLLKDPEYQKTMLEIMSTPDYQKMVMSVMKSPQYRQQVMTMMQEALQNPLYKTELMALFQKVAQEQMKPQQSDMTAKSSDQSKGGGGGGDEGSKDKKDQKDQKDKKDQSDQDSQDEESKDKDKKGSG